MSVRSGTPSCGSRSFSLFTIRRGDVQVSVTWAAKSTSSADGTASAEWNSATPLIRSKTSGWTSHPSISVTATIRAADIVRLGGKFANCKPFVVLWNRSVPSGSDGQTRKTVRRWRLRCLELFEHSRSLRSGNGFLGLFTAHEHSQEGLWRHVLSKSVSRMSLPNFWTLKPKSHLIADKLFVVGGSDGCQALCTTEVFDFETNTWSPGPSMTSCRANTSLAVVDDKLFAVGGFSGTLFRATSFEMFLTSNFRCRQSVFKQRRVLGSGNDGVDHVRQSVHVRGCALWNG